MWIVISNTVSCGTPMIYALRLVATLLAIIVFVSVPPATGVALFGQERTDPVGPVPVAEGDTDVADATNQAVATDPAASDDQRRARLNPFQLLMKGSWLMLPIALMSISVVAFGIERAIGLRKFRVMPQQLVDELGGLGDLPDGFDPRKAYRICQKYPSAAATVIRSMLLKIGRPHGEVEHAVHEVSQREADRMYDNVRWLNLAAAVTPLMGLLGTVWGMIQAFFDTTQLVPGQNKADFLAEGIYVALVTTLGGLAVAIPAAILAHYFEGRIQRLFHQIDEMLFGMMPQIERYEGRVRVSVDQLSDTGEVETDGESAGAAQVVPPTGVPSADSVGSGP